MQVEPGLVGRASQTLAPGLWLPDFSTPHATGGSLRGPEPRREPPSPISSCTQAHMEVSPLTNRGLELVLMHRHCSSTRQERPRPQLAIWGRPGYQGMVPTAAPAPALASHLQGSPEELNSQQGLLQALAQYWVGVRVPAYLHSWSLSKNPLGGPGCLGRGWLFGGLGWDKGRGGLDHPVDPSHGP